MEHYRQRFGFRLFGYVLMSNHVHLLLETKSVPLSKIMQGIQFSYTKDSTVLLPVPQFDPRPRRWLAVVKYAARRRKFFRVSATFSARLVSNG